MKFSLIIILLIAIVGCDVFRTSADICNADYNDDKSWTYVKKAPNGFENNDLVNVLLTTHKLDILNPMSKLQNADYVWYKRDTGGTRVCIVFKSMKYPSVFVTFKPNMSVSNPFEIRIRGASW